MAAIQNDNDVLLQAAGTRVNPVALPTNVTLPFDQVNGATKPSNNADVSTTTLGASGTSILMTSGVLFKTTTGLGGVQIGANGILGKDGSGNTTISINPSNGAVSVAGAITGGSTITITGAARFDGVTTSSGETYAGVFNALGNSTHGLAAVASSTGKAIVAFGVNGPGLSATSVNGNAVDGRAANSGGIGVHAENQSTGTALEVIGKMTINNATLIANLNSDQLDGFDSGQFTNVVVTDSGTATAAGFGISMNCTIAGYQFVGGVGSGNNVTLQPVSDRRLKQDIAAETLGLEFINSLLPVTYRMRANPARLQHGFIAQDIEPLIAGADDSLRLTDARGAKGVDYMSLLAPLVLAVQQLSAEVQQLKAQA